MLFFQLMSRRYEHASTVLTSNKGFEEWGEIFGDEVMAAALVNRLVHHCHIVNIRGNRFVAGNPGHHAMGGSRSRARRSGSRVPDRGDRHAREFAAASDRTLRAPPRRACASADVPAPVVATPSNGNACLRRCRALSDSRRMHMPSLARCGWEPRRMSDFPGLLSRFPVDRSPTHRYIRIRRRWPPPYVASNTDG
jgi:hypothetical protein